MRFASCLPLLGLLGCTASTGTVSVLRVSVTSAATQVTAGFPVALQIVAVNEGDRPISVHLPTCVPAFEAIDESGARIGPGGGVVCAPVAPAPTMIAPGRSVALVATWLTRTGLAPHLVPVAAGRYRLRATNFRVLPGAMVRYDETSVSITN